MDIVDVLKNYALGSGWKFVYARRDYQNLIGATDFVADAIEGFGIGESALILDPVNRKSTESGIECSGNFLVLTKSDLDDDYESRFDKYIKPLIHLLLIELKNSLVCNFDVNTWNSTEVINMFDWNADGLLISYSVRGYE